MQSESGRRRLEQAGERITKRLIVAANPDGDPSGGASGEGGASSSNPPQYPEVEMDDVNQDVVGSELDHRSGEGVRGRKREEDDNGQQ